MIYPPKVACLRLSQVMMVDTTIGGYTRSVNQDNGMMFDKRTIRPAVVEDASAIAQVHVESWKTTYKGIFPESLLDRLSVSDRTRFWNETLAKPSGRFVTLVACDEAGRVVGFVCGGAERTGQLGCDGELQAMYLLEGVQRQGLGSLLIRRFVRELRSAGFNSMAVWVIGRNPSRKFYEALGGRAITEQQIERGGESYVEIAYGWRDLSEFQA